MAEDSQAEDSEEEAAMHGDVRGIVLSFAIVFFFLGVSTLIYQFGKDRLGSACSEVARKVVHIGVSNWFFIYYFVFETDIWPIIGLVLFTIMNAAMNVTGLLKTMMGQENKKRNWGLVEYPISIIILLVLKMCGVGDAVALGSAILGMGYGDGLASLVGMAVKSKRLNHMTKKTYAGSVTMLLVTFIVTLAMKMAIGHVAFSQAALVACLAAVVATVVEAITPFGMDNISVPVVIYLIVGLL